MIRLPTSAARQRDAHAQVRLMISLEVHAQRALALEFGRVAGECALSWRDHGRVDMGKVLHGHETRLASVLRKIYSAAALTFARRVLDHKPKARSRADAEGSTEASVETWIREWTASRVKDITKSTERLIMAAVNAHQQEQLTRDEVASAIADKLGGEHALARAHTIARTETHSASMYGSMTAAAELGIPDLKKIWVTTHDEHAREAHTEADGQSVPVDGPFIVDDEELDFPGDPSGSASNIINCRCAMVYE